MIKLTVNIFADPVTSADIARRRAELREEMSLGMKVLVFCPIPVLDVVAGLATEAIDYTINGDRDEPYRDVSGATQRDWSSTSTSRSYVDKVRAQNRELIHAEVIALERYNGLVGTVTGTAKDILVGTASGVAKDIGGAIVDEWKLKLANALGTKR